MIVKIKDPSQVYKITPELSVRFKIQEEDVYPTLSIGQGAYFVAEYNGVAHIRTILGRDVCIATTGLISNRLNSKLKQSLLNSNTTKPMETLNKLLWDRFFSSNEKKIIKLVEELDDLVEKFGINFDKITEVRSDIERALQLGDKQKTKKLLSEIDLIIDLLKSKEFALYIKSKKEFNDLSEKHLTYKLI